MTYNLTNFTSANDLLSLAIASNQLVDGWLFTLVIGIMYGVLFVGFKAYETKSALAGSGVLMFVFVGMLWAVRVVGDGSLMFSFVVMLFTLAVAIIMD